MGLSWVFGYSLLVSTDELFFRIMSWVFALATTIQVKCFLIYRNRHVLMVA